MNGRGSPVPSHTWMVLWPRRQPAAANRRAPNWVASAATAELLVASDADNVQTPTAQKTLHRQRLLGGSVGGGELRPIEVESVSKMLACSTSILGLKQYSCANERCHHIKYLCNTCHCRDCPSCGKKATDQWIAIQNNRLPDCAWHHLVFTLPDVLWPLFFHNRGLLDALCRLAADNLLHAAQQRGLNIGLFGAIHTYGRRLNWHPHVHLSATASGLDAHGAWKNMAFHEKAMRQRWMWSVRTSSVNVTGET